MSDGRELLHVTIVTFPGVLRPFPVCEYRWKPHFRVQCCFGNPLQCVLVVMYFDGSMLWCFPIHGTTWWPSTLWGPLQRSYGGLFFLSFLLPFRFYVMSFVARVIMKQFGY